MHKKTPKKLSVVIAREAAAERAPMRRKQVARETPTAEELRGIKAGVDEIARGESVTLDEVLDELGRRHRQARSPEGPVEPSGTGFGVTG